MNNLNRATSVRPALVISAITALLVGVVIALPTPDFVTLILGVGVALIPLIVLLALTNRIIRRRAVQFSRLVSVALGAGVGLSTGFLSVSAFQFGSYLLS